MPGQAGPVGARALDPHAGQGPEAGEPGEEVAVAAGIDSEGADTQHAAVDVEGGSHMSVEVGVDAARHRARALYDGHVIPLLFEWLKGWHARPGKETVAIGLLQQADQPPSGTGRAAFPPPGRQAPSSTSVHIQSDQATVTAERSHHPHQAGGSTPRWRLPILTGQYALIPPLIRLNPQ